jgi:hypothetical protein
MLRGKAHAAAASPEGVVIWVESVLCSCHLLLCLLLLLLLELLV